MLRLITIWPFCREIVEETAARDVQFLVPEMNLGQVAEMVRAAASGRRVEALGQVNGKTIAPASILAAIEGML
jgi:pyruvate/2-oxoacid:ferredoxin oxidoreductase alpha subunit